MIRQDPSPEIPILVGEDAAIVTLREDIARVARGNAPVLVLGETGTGKEVVARLIHAHSSRRDRAFVTVNCSGIPETLLESELFGHVRGSFTGAFRDRCGLVEQAHHGTLFLDELGEMGLRMQAVLLRCTETGEFRRVGADSAVARADVRIISATHRDLRARIQDGVFREDLYYRLNVVVLEVPPLRYRRGDISRLIGYYLERAARDHGRPVPMLTPAVSMVLQTYDWPGNVRELRNVAERLVIGARTQLLEPDDLPVELRRVSAVVGNRVSARVSGGRRH